MNKGKEGHPAMTRVAGKIGLSSKPTLHATVFGQVQKFIFKFYRSIRTVNNSEVASALSPAQCQSDATFSRAFDLSDWTCCTPSSLSPQTRQEPSDCLFFLFLESFLRQPFDHRQHRPLPTNLPKLPLMEKLEVLMRKGFEAFPHAHFQVFHHLPCSFFLLLQLLPVLAFFIGNFSSIREIADELCDHRHYAPENWRRQRHHDQPVQLKPRWRPLP